MITTTSKKLTVNVSPAVQCTRLVHDGKKVLSLFESAGSTHTTNTLFCGTAAECAAEIARLNLAPLPSRPSAPPSNLSRSP